MVINKKILIGAIAAIAVVAVATCYILFGGNDKYKELIPSSAGIVVKINIADAADAAGMTSDEGKAILKAWMEKATSNEQLKDIEKYLESPEEIGLRLDHDIFLFIDPQKSEAGMVVEMYKPENFKNFLIDIDENCDEKSFQERNDLTWFTKDPNGGATIAFNSDYAIIIFSQTAENDILRLAKLASDEKYIKTDRFKHLDDVKGQVAFEMSLGCVPEYSLIDAEKAFEQIYGSGLSLKDLNIAYGVKVKKGAVEISGECFTENEKMNELFDKAYEAYGKIDGEFINNNTENLLCWIGMNYNGEKGVKMYEEILKNLPVKADAQPVIDVLKSTLASIDGDVMFAIDNSPSAVHQSFSFDFRSEVNDKKVAQKFTEGLYANAPQVQQMITQRDDEYAITVPFLTKGEPIARYGVKGNVLYFTTLKTDKENDTKLGDWKSTIKDSYMFLYVDATTAENIIKEQFREHYIDRETRLMLNVLSQLKDAAAYMTKKNSVSMVVNMKDDDMTLVQLFDKLQNAR